MAIRLEHYQRIAISVVEGAPQGAAEHHQTRQEMVAMLSESSQCSIALGLLWYCCGVDV